VKRPGGSLYFKGPYLSVSSNGSEWVKLSKGIDKAAGVETFSILKRIGVGETWFIRNYKRSPHYLSVSSNGSEWVKRIVARCVFRRFSTFSILKRIGVGETKSWA